MTGTVYLVGAGPGDPRLLTLWGAEVLRRADAVVYDRLVSPALLELAPTRAERVYVGKAPGRLGHDQRTINALLVELALRSHTVVRLKGGDPFVFGRGAEEALACAAVGVECVIVPGVTAAVAAPAAIGVPLTHRGLGSSFVVLTARAAGGAEADLRAAVAADTVVVLMGATGPGRTCRRLIAAGRSPDEPAAMVESATTAGQRSVVATLATLPARVRAARLSAPATIVCGEVVRLALPLRGTVAGAVASPAAPALVADDRP